MVKLIIVVDKWLVFIKTMIKFFQLWHRRCCRRRVELAHPDADHLSAAQVRHPRQAIHRGPGEHERHRQPGLQQGQLKCQMPSKIFVEFLKLFKTTFSLAGVLIRVERG